VGEDGGTYSRTTYANLFAAVTTTLTGHIFIGSSSISGSFASLVGQGLEGGGGRGHPDFHDGREHHLDDDRHFPERQRVAHRVGYRVAAICPESGGLCCKTILRLGAKNIFSKSGLNREF
jgi:hypothetical protein